MGGRDYFHSWRGLELTPLLGGRGGGGAGRADDSIKRPGENDLIATSSSTATE